MTTNNITTVRQLLLDQMSALRSVSTDELAGEISRAKALAEVTQAITNVSKVEAEYLRHAGSNHSTFLEAQAVERIEHDDDEPSAHNPFPGRTVHRLVG